GRVGSPQARNRTNELGGRDMRRVIMGLVAIAASGIGVAPARGEHAKIQLEVTTPRGQATAFMDQTPPEWGKNPRPVVKARVRETIRIQYFLTNICPHKTLEKMFVHFFGVK